MDVDLALRHVQPEANRWDFGIAYKHSNRDEEFVYWVELHTAATSEVGVVIRKARWLLDWLKNGGKRLAVFEKEILWVSSGATHFTLGATQKKRMAEAGLQHAGNRLRISDRRRTE